jgi:hypothetical protein
MTGDGLLNGKRFIGLMNHRDLDDSLAFIEKMTGSKMTPEEVEELRRLLEKINGWPQEHRQ